MRTQGRIRAARIMIAAMFFSAGPIASVTAPALAAENYPSKPIRLIHGFGPGGPADSISRIIGDGLSKVLKQPVVVEPRPGAGGNIGSETVARAEPDGYTLGLVTGGHAVSGALYSKLPFDPVASFQPISTLVDYAFIVAVRPGFEADTMPRFLALAKAKPGAINFGSAGVGSTQHLTGELLNANGGIRMVHVPYRGDAAAVTALVGNQVHAVIAAPAVVVPQIKAGAVKALAVTTSERWSGLPDVPTVAESGVAGFDVRTWAGIVAPKGTPQPIVDRLTSAIKSALAIPEVREKLETIVAGTARTRSPDEMREMLTGEVARWNKVIDAANIPRQ